LSRFLKKRPTPKVDRLKETGRQMLGGAYERFVPRQAKSVVSVVDKQGLRIRENIKSRSPKGKEIVKRYVMKGVHVGLTPVRVLTEKEEPKRRRR